MSGLTKTAARADDKVKNQATALETIGTPEYTVTKGPLEDVKRLFPVGCMHSIAARVAAVVEVPHDSELCAVLGANAQTPPGGGGGGVANSRSVKHITLDVCIYVGQCVDEIAGEFAASKSFTLVEPPTAEDLKQKMLAQLREREIRVTGPDNYVPQWQHVKALVKGTSSPPVRPSSPSMAARMTDSTAVRIDPDHPDGEPPPPRGGPSAAARTLPARTDAVKPAAHGWSKAKVAAEKLMVVHDIATEKEKPPTTFMAVATKLHGELHEEDSFDSFKKAHLLDSELTSMHSGLIKVRPRQSSLATAAIAAWASIHWKALIREETHVYKKGAVGENILHLCCLVRNSDPVGHDIIDYLVETFGPRLVNAPYQMRKHREDAPGLFDGERALHIAIVNKDLKLVQYLVEHGADVRARCFGGFFAKSGNCYYGEFPAHFAVCNSQKEIVKYLVDKGAQINKDRDSNGNYALHMAVYHSRSHMYDYLVDELNADHTLVNAEGHSPLTLAAQTNNTKMFEHIYKKHRKVVWKYGPVTCTNVPLRNIDTLQPVDDDKMCQSALHNVVANGHLDVLSDSLLQDILRNKWNEYAWNHFALNMLAYMCNIVVFTLLCQHYRHGLVTTRDMPPLLKQGLWSIVNCADDGVTLYSYLDSNGNPALGRGQGRENCNAAASLGYPGNYFDVESTVLEVATLAGAIAFLMLEMWDVLMFVRYRNRISVLLQREDVRPPEVPPLYPIPGTPITNDEASKLRKKWAAIRDARSGTLGGFRQFGAVISSFVAMDPENVIWAYLHEVHPTTYLLYAYAAVIIYHFSSWYQDELELYQPELAVAAVLSWLYLLYFARGFQYVGHLVIMIFRIFTVDIVRFAAVYCVFLGGFGVACFVLIREEYLSQVTLIVDGDFMNLGSTFLRLFRHGIGDFIFDFARDNEASPYLLWAIVFGFTICGNVVMFNLLIALMSNTFAEVSADAERQWRLQWARIILLMERRWGPQPAGQILVNLIRTLTTQRDYKAEEDARHVEKFHTIQEVSPDFTDSQEQQDQKARAAALTVVATETARLKAVEERVTLENMHCRICGEDCALAGGKRMARGIISRVSSRREGPSVTRLGPTASEAARAAVPEETTTTVSSAVHGMPSWPVPSASAEESAAGLPFEYGTLPPGDPLPPVEGAVAGDSTS